MKVLKQMLVNNQKEISCLDKIQWEKISWTRLSLIDDETVISLQRVKVYVFSDSVLCLGRVLQHPESNEAWKNRVGGVQSEKTLHDLDINIILPVKVSGVCPKSLSRSLILSQSCNVVNPGKMFHLTSVDSPLIASKFNDISCDRKGNKDEYLANAGVVKVLARRFGVGQYSFFGPGSEKKWYSHENSPQGAWDNIAEEMLLEFAESGHPTFRATTPLSRGQLKSKGRGKLSIHFTADQDTVDTIYRIILSVNQLSVYGAVAALCEEFNQKEITGLDKILYQKNSWTQLSLINDPVVINLQSIKVYVFSDSVLCLGKVLQHPECNEAWKNRVAGVRAEREKLQRL